MKQILIIAAVAIVVVAAVAAVFFMQSKGSDGSGPILGGDRDEHGCIGSAGYSWCEAKQKCLRTWEEPCSEIDCATMHDEIENDFDEANFCEADADCKYMMLGGSYVQFGCYKYINKATDENKIKEKLGEYVASCNTPIDKCAQAPDAVCSAGKCVEQQMVGGDTDAHGCIGSAGYTWCEAKQKCLRDFEEPCGPTECAGMSFSEAMQIAGESECGDNITFDRSCNNGTKTWWIELKIERAGCNPACVVNTETKQAEINFRCTGLNIIDIGCIPDPNKACTLEYAPVCGTDGVTYGNGCQAGAACVTIAHEGECN